MLGADCRATVWPSLDAADLDASMRRSCSELLLPPGFNVVGSGAREVEGAVMFPAKNIMAYVASGFIGVCTTTHQPAVFLRAEKTSPVEAFDFDKMPPESNSIHLLCRALVEPPWWLPGKGQ